MRVLVACEESQEVTKAYRNRGITAFSCDIQEQSGGFPEWHLKGDVRNWLYEDWDLIVAHPPCTYLCNSGVRWLTGKNKKPGRFELMKQGAEFFKLFLDHPCKHIAIENPIMHKYAVDIVGRKHDQLIQPYMFGHLERKATCFWLKGLPPLKGTNDVKTKMETLPKSKAQRLFYASPGPERDKIRSKTYSGIAQAIAQQWVI